MIPQNIIDEILNRISLSELIRQYVDVKKRGKDYSACCPFHNEKTPSFFISDSKGVYHCFGCGASGNAITFLMEYKKYTFMEAVNELAKIANIDLSKYNNNTEYQTIKEKDIIYQINDEAALFYQKLLVDPEDPSGVNYIKSRRIKGDIVKLFRLGYGGKKYDALYKHLISKNYSKELILKAGLCINTQNGIMDKFRERIIFPIYNKQNKIAGFGGRILNDDKKLAKYINTSETPVFIKNSLLYGLNFAIESISKENLVFIVEGYFDVIAMHQIGIKNTVAPLGTSLGINQLRILSRICKRFVFLFDGDDAGIKAANRAIDISIDGFDDIEKYILILPNKMDPYDFALKYGKDKLLEYYEKNKLKTSDFKLKYLLNLNENKNNKLNFVKSAFSYIMRIKSAIERENVLKQTALLLNENYETILTEYNNYINRNNIGNAIKNNINNNKIEIPKNELEIIGLLILNPIYIKSDLISEEYFSSPIAKKYFEFIKSNSDKNSSEILRNINDGSIIRVVTILDSNPQTNFDKLFEELCLILKLNYIKRKMKEKTDLINEEEKRKNKDIIETLINEKLELKKEITEIEIKLKNIRENIINL